ncbi:hypothetical protein BpHYR1_035980 [Brachionus plicatilis]|uniref:Uncharacterized protein n=1 Tax=Brachionus plicatilis TaxID=10195 RepID=A0A3M7PNB9_BRAPC|nr:hypothetical protein BpHYR1_035980 [Brachionus plicatilis]
MVKKSTFWIKTNYFVLSSHFYVYASRDSSFALNPHSQHTNIFLEAVNVCCSPQLISCDTRWYQLRKKYQAL